MSGREPSCPSMRSYIFRDIKTLKDVTALWNRIRGEIVTKCRQGPIGYATLVQVNNTLVRASIATVCYFSMLS